MIILNLIQIKIRTLLYNIEYDGLCDWFRRRKRQRFIKTVTELGKAFALCATEPTAQELNDEIAFFKAVKAGLVKLL